MREAFLHSGVIHNCCDSHVHWLATGAESTRWRLNSLKSESDVLKLNPGPQHYRGDWLVGFGWDQNAWSSQTFPHRKTLDEKYPDTPVCLSRVDGHGVWINSEALRRSGLLDVDGRATGLVKQDIVGGKIVLDEAGLPTGVLIDMAMPLVQRHITKIDSQQVRSQLLSGVKSFNAQGFTHIRDMSCSPDQWQQSVSLEESGELTLAVEQYFSAENPANFDKALSLAKQARAQKQRYLRAQGLKVYYDGALGSEGALLSHPYKSGSGKGLVLLEDEQLYSFMRTSWENDFDFAIHTIGDEAAHQVVVAANKVWSEGYKGVLHLEHAEMLRAETIALMQGQSVRCHMQPCHWLSDKHWLKDKFGEAYADMLPYMFAWKALQEKNITFDFGSDSPIEPVSLQLNLDALTDSAKAGIPTITDPIRYHSHPDHDWLPNTYSEFKNGKAHKVIFDGCQAYFCNA